MSGSPTGRTEPLAAGSMGPPTLPGRTPNPYMQGGRTPGWGQTGQTGRTPNPYNDARTPAWNASARTPNPYADSSKTPAWNAGARTPNPYASDGGKTPAWNVGSRTPNPYTNNSGVGGATPARPTNSNWGGATPGRNTWSGDASPARPNADWTSPSHTSTWMDNPSGTWVSIDRVSTAQQI